MVKRAIRFCLILIIFKSLSFEGCFAGSGPLPLPLRVKIGLCREANEVKQDFVIGACLLGIMFLACYQAQVDRMPASLKSQFRPQNLAANFASTYCMCFATQFFHELGHGLAKKLLAGCNFKIHLGDKPSLARQPIIDSKYVSLEGFDPQVGFNTNESSSIKKYTSLQKIFINLAGGASGILGYYFTRAAAFYVYNVCQQGSKVDSRDLRNAIHRAIVVDQIVVNQLFNMLIPAQSGGDAAKVWQELGISDSSTKAVGEIQPYLAMLASIALSFRQSGSRVDDERYVADKVLIGLANFFLQGFFQFKSA